MKILVVFQLWTFLALGSFLVISLAIIYMIPKLRDGYNDLPASKNIWFFIAFLLLGGAALFTVQNYIFPSKDVFSNTQYHILEHLGFKFNKKLHLVNSDFNQEAIWDGKSGKLTMEVDSGKVIFKSSNFSEPLFIHDPQKGNYFKLAYCLIDCDVSEGFKLMDGDSLIFDFKIVPIIENGKKRALYLSRFNKDYLYDTSTFKLPINRGYPLIDILLKTPNIRVSDKLRLLVENSILVRDSIPILNLETSLEDKRHNISPLRFFPNPMMYESGMISIDNKYCFLYDTVFKTT
ncbi:MAG: hypothetical protein U1D64_04650, partial [Bacteroidales bacterium]|nr:hypothetical protein [Bacteroidales bacterium]